MEFSEDKLAAATIRTQRATVSTSNAEDDTKMENLSRDIDSKITIEAVKYAIETSDCELLDKVIRHWKESDNSKSKWHPLVYIASKNNFTLYRLLSSDEHKSHVPNLPKPHDYHCKEPGCNMDFLKHTKMRMATYKALCQPVYLLTKEDPIKEAMDRRKQLMENASNEKESKSEYEELGEQLEEFCCNMVNMCYTQKEVEVFLNRSGSAEKAKEEHLGTVDRAIHDGAKKFIVNEIVQQYIKRKFYAEGTSAGDFFHRLQLNRYLLYSLGPVFIVFQIPMVLVYALFGLIRPSKWYWHSKTCGDHFYDFVNVVRIPAIKYYTHTIWYVFFLLVVLLYTHQMGDKHPAHFHSLDLLWQPLVDGKLGPCRRYSFFPAHWYILLWVIGYAISDLKQMHWMGLRKYFSEFFNWVDTFMVVFYLFGFCLTLTAFHYTRQAVSVYRDYCEWKNLSSLVFNLTFPADPLEYYLQPDRTKWHPFDFETIGNCFFAFANLLSIVRLSVVLFSFQTLGPLLICFGKMIRDTLYFLAPFMIIFVAFYVGVYNVYGPYRHGTYSTEGGAFFALFWSLYGKGDVEADSDKNQTLVKGVGVFMLGAFHVVLVIMLLNMLIAMLSSSYQHTETWKDMEWKFARSALFMEFITVKETLPVPFNIIPTVKGIFNKIVNVFKPCLMRRQRKMKIERTKEYQDLYKHLMNRLKNRYMARVEKCADCHQLRSSKTGDKPDTETVEDASDIKTLISSYFELRLPDHYHPSQIYSAIRQARGREVDNPDKELDNLFNVTSQA